MILARAMMAASLALLAACTEREPPPSPAATRLAEPLAMVRTSGLVAGAAEAAPAVANPYADDPSAVTQGRQLFLSFNCAGCHGPGGGGGIGPPLADDEWIYGGSAANIYATIIQGRPNGMPAYGPSLQGEAVWKLAAYVRSLSEGSEGQDTKGQKKEDRERGP